VRGGIQERNKRCEARQRRISGKGLETGEEQKQKDGRQDRETDGMYKRRRTRCE
jgi:hypothetical protein